MCVSGIIYASIQYLAFMGTTTSVNVKGQTANERTKKSAECGMKRPIRKVQ